MHIHSTTSTITYEVQQPEVGTSHMAPFILIAEPAWNKAHSRPAFRLWTLGGNLADMLEYPTHLLDLRKDLTWELLAADALIMAKNDGWIHDWGDHFELLLQDCHTRPPMEAVLWSEELRHGAFRRVHSKMSRSEANFWTRIAEIRAALQ